MKTEKSISSSIKLIAFNLILFIFLIASKGLLAGQKTYDFKNGENITATDIHIEFDGNATFHTAGAGSDPTVEVPANSFKDGNTTNPSGSPSTANLAKGTAGAGGTGVAAGSTLSLTFDYTGDNPPNVKKWWWTKTNTLSSSLTANPEDTLGKPKYPEKKCYELVMAPATGNGQLFVTIAGVQNVITLAAGQNGAQNAISIVNYINSLPYGIATLTGPSSFSVSSAYNSGSPTDFSSGIIQQDNTQSMTMTDCTFAGAIPTLPQWGLILLGVILLSLGIVYLKRIF